MMIFAIPVNLMQTALDSKNISPAVASLKSIFKMNCMPLV